MLLVGLHGFQGAGKDTVAGILAESGFVRVAFADPMREALLALDPWIPTSVPETYVVPPYRLSALVKTYGWDFCKRTFPEVRRLLQAFGTEVGRKRFGEDFWVRQGMAQVGGKGGQVVITDVRFENEVAAIKAHGGFVFNVVRPGHGPKGDHASEQDLSHLCDRTIDNDGTLDDLVQTVALSFRGLGFDPRVRL